MALAASRRTACLPWYDLAEVRGANDAFWAAIRTRLRDAGLDDVPPSLCRRPGHGDRWTSPGLLLGQACGYDVLIAAREALRIVATPHYSATGCHGVLHRSYVVVRDDAPWTSVRDLRGTRCAYNKRTSHSGRNALRALVAPHHEDGRFFGATRCSGSHERSLAWIRDGAVDVAAVDCVTWALIGLYRPAWQAGLRVLAETAPVTAPPFVTSRRVSRAEVALRRDAITQTLADPRLAGVRERLLLSDVSADALGYRELV